MSWERISGIEKHGLEVRILACGKLVRDPPLFYLPFVLSVLLQGRILVLLKGLADLLVNQSQLRGHLT